MKHTKTYKNVYVLPFLLYGFDAVTLSDANARVLDRCLDRAVYRIVGVCDKDNVSSLRTLLFAQRL